MTNVVALADGFEPVDHDAWVEAAEATLRGRSVDSLARTTEDGIVVPALRTVDDLPEVLTAQVGRAGPWTVLQRHAHPDPAAVNRHVLEDLAGGVDGVVLGLSGPDRLRGHGPFDGIAVTTLDDLDRALDGVWLGAADVALDADVAWLTASTMLLQLWERREVAREDRRGWLDADPVGACSRLDGGPVSLLASDMERLGALALAAADAAPDVRVALADGRPYAEAGGSAAQQVGFVLATAHAYLEALVAAGLDVDAAARRVSLQLGLAADQFEGIAALRALRSCWTRVLALCGATDPSAAVEVRACSSRRVMTEVDPWVNLLRGTVVGFAGAAGGADVLTIEAFDRMLGEPSALGRRMARNTHVVLAEEAHLARVADPAGGAWHVEALTEALADEAWALFQWVLDAGGVVTALGSGAISERLEVVANARLDAVHTRRRPITGVTTYPLVGERLPDTRPFASEQLREEVGRTLADAPDVALDATSTDDLVATLRAAVAGGASLVDLHDLLWPGSPSAGSPRVGSSEGVFGGLPIVRDATGFESLRRRVEAYDLGPVFLANLGPLAEHTPRTGFAANVYAVGGLTTHDGGSHDDVATLSAAFVDSGARVACLCGSDERYAAMAEDAARGLVDAGALRVDVAGRFGAHEGTWREAGIAAAVSLGSDVLAFLTGLASILVDDLEHHGDAAVAAGARNEMEDDA